MDTVKSRDLALIQLLEQGWAFHPAAGHLSIRLSGVALSVDVLSAVLLPALTRLVETECRPGSNDNDGDVERAPAVRKAVIDLSSTGLSDEALHTFLAGWCKLGLGSCAMCLMLQKNKLSDQSLELLGHFAALEATGAVEELHLSHQVGLAPLSRAAVLSLLAVLAKCSKYPIWVKRTKSYRPVHLRLDSCGVSEPEEVVKELEDATGARVCFADDQGCVRTACAYARQAGGCPVAHLFNFRNQERPEANEQAAPEQPDVALASCEGDAKRRRRGKVFLCGACNRELSIDMFTRSQFQKADKLDEERDVDMEGDEAVAAQRRAHRVRRCNDCVRQPCCACGKELPLSAFANTQMYRPTGSRRCRPCAAFTWLCARCGRPRDKSAFSSVEALKRKQVAKICQDCEVINPYFERRHAVCIAFSGRYSKPPACLPALAREVVLRILDFAREARFVRVTQKGFECTLCGRSWSLLTSGDSAPIERHLRTSRVHARRLRSVDAGHLVEIASTGLDVSRFRDGLGLQGAFCGQAHIDEARHLVDLWQLRVAEPTLSVEALRAAGCAVRSSNEDPQLGPRWAAEGQVAAARTMCIEAHAAEGEVEEMPEAESMDVDRGEDLAHRRRGIGRGLRKMQKLCAVPQAPAEAEGDQSGEEQYGVDEAELDEVRRFLLLGCGQ